MKLPKPKLCISVSLVWKRECERSGKGKRCLSGTLHVMELGHCHDVHLELRITVRSNKAVLVTVTLVWVCHVLVIHTLSSGIILHEI